MPHSRKKESYWNSLTASCRHYHLEKEVDVSQIREQREGDSGKKVFPHVFFIPKMMASKSGSNWKLKDVSIVKRGKKELHQISNSYQTCRANIWIKDFKSRPSDNSLDQVFLFSHLVLRKIWWDHFFSNPVHLCSNLNHSFPRQTLPAFVWENVPDRIFWSGKPK